MALVRTYPVLPMPTTSSGETPSRCRRRRVDVRFLLARRDILNSALAVRERPVFDNQLLGVDRQDEVRYTLGSPTILVDRGDDVGVRDAGNAVSHRALTRIFGQHVHLSLRLVLIHASSSRGRPASASSPAPPSPPGGPRLRHLHHPPGSTPAAGGRRRLGALPRPRGEGGDGVDGGVGNLERDQS